MDKRFRLDTGCFIDMQENKVLTDRQVNNLLNELDRLAEANEEQGLAIMTYLHDNYYDIWEEVNKEVFGE